MRKLNLAWFLGFLIGIASVSVVMFFVHGFQVSRNATAFLRQAKRAQGENRSKDAIDHLRRYVKLAPDDNEGQILFGLLLAELGQNQPAFLILDKSISRSPDRTDVRHKLVDLSMKLGQYSEAMDQLKRYLLPVEPDNGLYLEELGDCQIALAEYKVAEASLEAAIATGSGRLEAYMKLALLRKDKLKRPGDAMEPLHQMVARNPDNYLAYYYRVQWLMQRWNELKASSKLSRRTNVADLNSLLELANSDVKQALKLAPNKADTILLGVQVAHESGRDDEARSLARQGIEVEPLSPRFYLVLAELEMLTPNPAAAIDLLRRGSAAIPNDLELKWLLAEFLIESGEDFDAATIIQQLRAAKHTEPLITYLEGKLSIRRGDWMTAIRQLESSRSGLRERTELAKQIDYWLGIANRELKSPNQELICFRRALALDPDWVPARIALAETLMNAGFYDEAIAGYRMVVSKPGAPTSAALGLARSLLIANLRTKGELRNWRDFDDIVSQIEKQPVVPFQVAILKMEKLLANDERDEAAKVVAVTRETCPNEIDLWTAQIGLAQLDRDWNRVEQLLHDANEIFGDIVALRTQKGRYLIQRLESEAADPLRTLSEPLDSWTHKERMQLANAFAQFFLAIREYDDAERLAALVSNSEPQNVSNRLFQLEVALRANRTNVMGPMLDDLRTMTGDGAIWNYGQAVLITLLVREKPSKDAADDIKLDQAISHLKKAAILSPSWERIPLLMAEIYESKGMSQAATDQYIEAIQLGERKSNVISHVLALLFYDRRFEDAQKLIRRLRDFQSTFTDEMVRAEVDVSLQLGRKEDALRTAEQLVRNSELGQDPVWLGQVFIALGKNLDAEKQFRRAIDANPKDPKPWIGLVKALKETGSVVKAEIAVDEAKLAISEDQMMLAVARCYEILDKPDLARLTYRASADQSPDNLANSREYVDFLLKTGAASDAEAILRKIIKSSNENEADGRDHRLWANRKLATVLMMAGSPEQLNESLTIIDRNLAASSKKSSDDLRLKATILANGSSQTEHAEARRILEGLLVQEPTSASALNDRFLLARLYLLLGDRPKARDELRKLIHAQKDDPRYLNAYAQLSLQAGEIREAELYLDLLKKLVPNELSTLDLQVQILYSRGKYSDIVNLLKGIGDAGVKDQRQAELAATSRLWAAKRLEEFSRLLNSAGKSEEAERLNVASEYCYEKFVKERPSEMLVLAAFLSQTDRVDRSLDLLQEYGPVSAPIRVASVAMSMLKNPLATKAQLGRLQQLLDSNVESHDKSLILEIASAEVLSWRGEYPAAITAYKKLLQRDGRSLAILNNLAVLTSLTIGDHAEAMLYLQKAFEYGGSVSELLDSRGLIHLAAGSPEKAVADFQQALSKNETAEGRFHLAAAFARLKQFDFAQESMDRADLLSISENDLHPLERNMLKALRTQLKAHGRSSQTTQTRL